MYKQCMFVHIYNGYIFEGSGTTEKGSKALRGIFSALVNVQIVSKHFKTKLKVKPEN